MVQGSTACTGTQGTKTLLGTAQKREPLRMVQKVRTWTLLLAKTSAPWKALCTDWVVFPTAEVGCVVVHMLLISVMIHGTHFQDGRSGLEDSV